MTPELAGTLLLAFLLIFLNAFFVLAELAAVKMRASRIEELSDQGHPLAPLLQHIHTRLDEYLSACQVGITLASIGLGAVGEPAAAELLTPLARRFGGGPALAHTIAVAAGYLGISFLHILFGELVPKMLAIRRAEGMALRTARLLRAFRTLFYPPLVVLNGSAQFILRLLGLSARPREGVLTEDELRIVLERSQSSGLMSFQRLLLMENIFDLGDIRVKNAMRPRDAVRVLRTDAPWEENFRVIQATRLSRYPLVEPGSDRPLGVLHVKDLLHRGPEMAQADLRKLARPYATTTEETLLEQLLADLQRRRAHVAIVLNDAGSWTGFISLEDILEEVVGAIEDEFESEHPVFLVDTLTPGRILLDLKAATMEGAIRETLSRMPAAELPRPAEAIIKGVIEREKAMSTYLGHGLAVPHMRLEGIERPVCVIGRSDAGVAVPGNPEKAHLIFILLTPAATPAIQVRLLARVVGLIQGGYVEDRLREAKTPREILEAIRAGDPVSLG